MHDRPLVHRDNAFRRWRSVSQGAVRPDCIVVYAPLFDKDLGFSLRVEDFAVEQLIADSGVEALTIAVLAGGSRLDVCRFGADRTEPVPDLLGDKFRSISPSE